MSATILPFPTDRRRGAAQAGPATIVQLHAPAPGVEISRTPELALFLGLYASIGTDQQATTRRTLEALACGGDPAAVAASKLLSGGR